LLSYLSSAIVILLNPNKPSNMVFLHN
jgi:hypothetical protein